MKQFPIIIQNRLVGIFSSSILPYFIVLGALLFSNRDAFSEIRLSDIYYHTTINEEKTSASLDIELVLQMDEAEESLEDVVADIQLYKPMDIMAAQSRVSYFKRTGNKAVGRLRLPIYKPQLWSAETPVMHRLEVQLIKGEQTLQQMEQLVGLRELQWEGNQWLLNGSTLTLRGIRMDVQPQKWPKDVEGWQQWLQQYQLANINTLYFPFIPRDAFLDLCHQMGFYVLARAAVLDDERIVNATTSVVPLSSTIENIQSVKNHASIIAWVIEEGVFDHQSLIKQIRGLDTSRPIVGVSPKQSSWTELTDILFVEGKPSEAYFRMVELNKPYVYLHTLTNRHQLLGEINSLWRNIKGLKQGAGMIVAPKSKSPTLFSLTKKLYSPIWIYEDVKTVEPGEQTVELTLNNEHDVLNLNDIRCQWSLLRNRKEVDDGTIRVFLPPQNTMNMGVRLKIPDDLNEFEYTLFLSFYSPNGRLITEETIWLRPETWDNSFVMRLSDLTHDEDFKINAEVDEIKIDHQSFLFRIRSATPAWFMMAKERNYRLITDGPFLSFGKSFNAVDKYYESEPLPSYHPGTYLLSDLSIQGRSVDQGERGIEVKTAYSAFDEIHQQWLSVQTDTLGSPFGFCDIRYQIWCGEVKDDYVNAGISFLIPHRMKNIFWLGNGPYPSEVSYTRHVERFFFGRSPIDQLWTGNRSHSYLAAFVDDRENGIGIMALDKAIAFEYHKDGILISIRSEPSSDLPQPKTETDAVVPDYNGSFRIIPLLRNHYPELFESILN